jgi:hypothetical protein
MPRAVTGDVNDPGAANAEPHVAAVAAPCVGQVDEHVGLRVKPRRLSHQLLEVDPVVLPAEPQVDALVRDAVP